MRLILKNISMYGFKNHEDLVEFELGENTDIYGDNGTGKTTIGEAIVWCLLGSDLTGNERATTRLINRKCKDVYVELKFNFKGEDYTLIRRRKGNATTIYLNDKTVSQSDLVNFYQSKELFLSIFNPNYFPTLAPREAKPILNHVLGEIPKKIVYSHLPDYIVEVLKNTGFTAPNLYLDNNRERLREIREEFQYWDGFIKAKQEDVEIPELMEFDSNPLGKLQEQLEEINSVKIEPFHNITELLKKQNSLNIRIVELKESLRKLLQQQPDLISTSEIESKLNALRSNYANSNKQLKVLNNVVKCPKCSTVIDLDSNLKLDLEKQLTELEEKGTNLTEKLEGIRKQNSTKITTHEKEKSKQINVLNSEISKLKDEIEALNIEKLEAENRKHIKEQEEKNKVQKDKLISQINELKEQEQIVTLNNAKREELLKVQSESIASVEKAKTTVLELEQEKADVEKQIEYAKQFNDKRLQIQSQQIGKYLNKVTIQLQKINKQTGEILDDFKVLYDGKEFPVLSNSERIKAGLEVANLLINKSGLTLPIFIDNAEAITEIPMIDTQTLEARVRAGEPLTVEVK